MKTTFALYSLFFAISVFSQEMSCEQSQAGMSLEKLLELQAKLVKEIENKAKAAQATIVIDKNGKEIIFVKDDSFPKLGEAYRDPTGLIWGDIVVDGVGNEVKKRYFLHLEEAKAHCESIGAKVPSKADFERLTGYFGTSIKGFSNEIIWEYSPKVIPNLFHEPNGYRTTYRFAYDTDEKVISNVLSFDGLKGIFNRESGKFALRCVIQK